MLRTLSSIGASDSVVAFTVHEPPEPATSPAEQADGLMFVKEGFNWFAFFVAPIWMLVNRLWLVFIGYIAVAAILGGTIALFEMDVVWALLANLGLNLIIALEADSLQHWSLNRKGWKMIGTVSGSTARECERRFFERWVAAIEPEQEVALADGRA